MYFFVSKLSHERTVTEKYSVRDKKSRIDAVNVRSARCMNPHPADDQPH